MELDITYVETKSLFLDIKISPRHPARDPPSSVDVRAARKAAAQARAAQMAAPVPVPKRRAREPLQSHKARP